MKWLGLKLKDAVKQANLTQEQFAKLMGVSRPTVISWMKDQVPKGAELMRLCGELRVEPNSFFENDVIFSHPRHRLVAHAKPTKELDEKSYDFINEFGSFFKENMSSPLQMVIKYNNQQDPTAVASELRKTIGLTNGSPIRLQHVFDLAKVLGLFIVPTVFPRELSHKTSALYTLFGNYNKVIFVNNTANCLDLVYFLLHEICHAVINNGEVNDEEEVFCEATARATQFPRCYVSEVYSDIKGKPTGMMINKLKEYSLKNHHSLYGIAIELDKYFDAQLSPRIGGAFRNLNKQVETLGEFLCKDADVSLFIKRFQSITPLYFDEVISAVYRDVSDRKLCELLGLSDTANVDGVRNELERRANAIQAGCAY